MTHRLNTAANLQTLFAGLVEQVFMAEIGICDTRLTQYLTDLLTDFVHSDRIHRLRDADNVIIQDVSRMEAEAALRQTASETERRRLINRYIGDYTLFWTGVYPEQLRARRQGGVDRLQEYLLQGKRSYGIASALATPDSDPPAALLANLSAQFECCVHGLHLVRESWERQSRN
jgi:hypothetical protein